MKQLLDTIHLQFKKASIILSRMRTKSLMYVAIALSYFLIEPFYPATGLNIVGFTSIIFMSSLVGYLISPIHLCNVVSSDYLKTDSTRMYKMYLPAVIVLLVVQIVFVYLVYAS